MAKRTAGYTSKGIGSITPLAAFLREFDDVLPLHPLSAQPDAVIGWGLKPTSRRARRYANKRRLPYVALEDGFLRSLGLVVPVTNRIVS